MRSLSSLLLLGVLAAGCATTSPPSGPPAPFVGTEWHLVRLGADTPSVASGTIAFGPDGRVSGTTGCNRFTGSYALGSSGAITLSQVGATKMACPGPAMEQEARVLEALGRAARVEVRGTRLTLLTGGTALLTFEAPRGAGTAAPGTVLNGTVTYRPRIALPPDAVLTVRLLDVSRADAASVTLAETTVPTGGAQVPLPFSLSYDGTRVEARNRYVVRAEIRDGAGALQWTTDTALPVLTNGAPRDGVEVPVVQVAEGGGSVSDAALVGPEWRLTEIRSASGVTLAVEAGAPYSLRFDATGRFSGQADCNRIGGAFEMLSGERIRFTQALSTLAECPAGSAAGAFLSALNSADRYSVAGNLLTLTGSDGTLALAR